MALKVHRNVYIKHFDFEGAFMCKEHVIKHRIDI